MKRECRTTERKKEEHTHTQYNTIHVQEGCKD